MTSDLSFIEWYCIVDSMHISNGEKYLLLQKYFQ